MPFQRFELLERPDIKQPDQAISSCRSDKMTIPTPLERIDDRLMCSSEIRQKLVSLLLSPNP